MATPDFIKSIPRPELQRMLDAGEVSPEYAADVQSFLGPKVDIGPAANIQTEATRRADALPPRAPETPPAEPALASQYKGGGAEPKTMFGTQQVVGNNIPRGAGNQMAAGLGLPVGGRDAPPAPAADLSGKDAVFNNLQPGAQTPPPAPGGAGDAFAGINMNAPEVKSNTQTGSSQVIESAAHKAAMQSANQHNEAAIAAEAARNQNLYAAGTEKARQQQGYIDQLQAGNDAYQAKVDARKARVDAVEGERAAASKAYQDTVKNVPLGTMLNPTAAQAMGSAIAQALGAFGSSMSHGPNAALSILDKQLDVAQRERTTQIQGKAFGVRMADKHLQDLRDIFHDDDAAHLAWKADIMGTFAQRLERQATLTGNQDIIDAGKVNAEAARQRQDVLNAQAAQHYEKAVKSETSTQTESGPMVALKAAEARLKASQEAGGNLPINWDKFEAWKDKDRAVKALIATGPENIPGALKRVVARYGGDVNSMNQALAAGFAGVDLTNQEKDALSAVFRIRNAEIKRITGAASSDKERGSIVAGAGLGDYNNANDVMRSVNRIAGELKGDRASMIAANGMFRDTFSAYDAAEAALPKGPSGEVIGRLAGQ